MKLRELELAKHQAEAAHRDLIAKKNHVIRGRVEAFKEIVAAEEGAIYDPQILAAQSQFCAAREAYEEEAESVALTGEGLPYPIGTILHEWERMARWQPGMKLTGKRGVVEVITRESKHPANKADYARAAVGSFVVRHLKKDGSAGLQYDPITSWRITNNWLPSGQKPTN